MNSPASSPALGSPTGDAAGKMLGDDASRFDPKWADRQYDRLVRDAYSRGGDDVALKTLPKFLSMFSDALPVRSRGGKRPLPEAHAAAFSAVAQDDDKALDTLITGFPDIDFSRVVNHAGLTLLELAIERRKPKAITVLGKLGVGSCLADMEGAPASQWIAGAPDGDLWSHLWWTTAARILSKAFEAATTDDVQEMRGCLAKGVPAGIREGRGRTLLDIAQSCKSNAVEHVLLKETAQMDLERYGLAGGVVHLGREQGASHLARYGV